MLLIYSGSFREIIYETILEYDWHIKGQPKGSWGKCRPTGWWKRGPSDKGHEKGQGTLCFFCLSFHQLVFPSGLPGPWASCRTGATSALKEDSYEALEPNWPYRSQKDQMGCTSGRWGRRLILLSLKHRGEQSRFLMAGKMQISHPCSKKARRGFR